MPHLAELQAACGVPKAVVSARGRGSSADCRQLLTVLKKERLIGMILLLHTRLKVPPRLYSRVPTVQYTLQNKINLNFDIFCYSFFSLAPTSICIYIFVFTATAHAHRRILRPRSAR